MSRRCELTGKAVRTGNNVSHAHNKSRRRFLPNLQTSSLLSDALGATVRLRVTPHALRSVDHRGGLDAYLLSTDDEKLSRDARRLKQRIRKAVAAGAAKAAAASATETAG